MVDDEFNELVKRKFAEFERKHGRVPTVPELAVALGVDSRILARKLMKAIATLGSDAQTEGTSAFKSTLRELLSGDILTKGVPGYMDLKILLEEGRHDPKGYAEMRWTVGEQNYTLFIQYHYSGTMWSLHGSGRVVFTRITDEISDICELLESHLQGEKVDPTLITHMSGEPVPFVPEELPYQDPISEQELPANVLPFRKPYQHSED